MSADFELGPKTQALMARMIEYRAGRRQPRVTVPELDRRYRAGDLPERSVVRTAGPWCAAGPPSGVEYVIGRSGMCMRWEQPIPGSDDWQVFYSGCLPDGVWMTPRELAEVMAVRRAAQ